MSCEFLIRLESTKTVFCNKVGQLNNIQDYYFQIKSEEARIIDLISQKLYENAEHTMLLKFNLKEIIELNEANERHIEEMKESSQYWEEVKEIKVSTAENDKIKALIIESLEKNGKIKERLEKILKNIVNNEKTNQAQFDESVEIARLREEVRRLRGRTFSGLSVVNENGVEIKGRKQERGNVSLTYNYFNNTYVDKNAVKVMKNGESNLARNVMYEDDSFVNLGSEIKFKKEMGKKKTRVNDV